MRRGWIASMVAVGLLAGLGGGLTGCREEGPAEELGRKMDTAAQNAADEVEDAADQVKKKMED